MERAQVEKKTPRHGVDLGLNPDIGADGILGSKETVTEQVFSGLDVINKCLGTDYKVSKIYFVPADGASDSVYRLLICKLINHYHSGNEFKEV